MTGGRSPCRSLSILDVGFTSFLCLFPVCVVSVLDHSLMSFVFCFCFLPLRMEESVQNLLQDQGSLDPQMDQLDLMKVYKVPDLKLPGFVGVSFIWFTHVN